MARPSSSARRYAEAAFAVAGETAGEAAKDGQAPKPGQARVGGGDAAYATWRRDLDSAATALAQPQLAQALANPAIPLEARQRLLDETLGSGLGERPRNLLRLLLERGRIELLPRVAEAFGELDDRRRGISRAVVTSAEPLTEDELSAIRARLGEATAGTTVLTTQTDPNLLGGVVVRIGDRLIDGSVRGRLERLRGRLMSGAA